MGEAAKARPFIVPRKVAVRGTRRRHPQRSSAVAFVNRINHRLVEGVLKGFLTLYYQERRIHARLVTVPFISHLQERFKDHGVFLIGGMGGFHFGPRLEHTLLKIVGGEVWAIGKGLHDGLDVRPYGVRRSGSQDYSLRAWHEEVHLVVRRIAAAVRSSRFLNRFPSLVFLGHSSGGLINYTLGLLKIAADPHAFAKAHADLFPGLAFVPGADLTTVWQLLQKSQFVSINTPFQGLCVRLTKAARSLLPPRIFDTITAEYLAALYQRMGVDPAEVISLATHSTISSPWHQRLPVLMASIMGNALKAFALAHQEKPNDGFVSVNSALLKGNGRPAHHKNLHLGTKDHRDVVELPEVPIRIFEKLV